MTKIRLQTLARLVLFAILLGAIFWGWINRDTLTSDDLIKTLENLDSGTTIVIFVLVYALATVLFLPGTLMALVGGVLFGPILGSLVNLAAATLGASIAFLISRSLAANWVTQKIAEKEKDNKLKKIVDGVNKEGWRFVAFVRLVPLFPFNLLNYLLGLTCINFRAYVITSFICMAPATTAFTYLGFLGREAFAKNQDIMRMGIIALGLVAFMVFLPRLIKLFRNNSSHLG